MEKFFAKILIAATVICGFTSCDKVENNGKFAGMWQLTEWKHLPDGRIEKGKESRIYYCVQLDLMEFRGAGSSYLSRFRRTADSLLIGTVYHGPKDDIVGYEELAKYGVPGNGKFALDKLTSTSLVLRSDTAQLTFRKF